MKAILLSAGQGKRLFPFTIDRPKCLLDINNYAIIEYQINTLCKVGIDQVVVVVGFKSKMVENYLTTIYKKSNINIKFCYNPFYSVSDNLATCWIARSEFDSDFLIVNGDDLFESSLIKKLLGSESVPVTVAVNVKEAYDADDMKVICDKNGRLLDIGKHLDCSRATGEAIGIYLFRKEGAEMFKNIVEEMMLEPEGLKKWYPLAVGELARRTYIATTDITGCCWSEIDFPEDLKKAKEVAEYITGKD